MRAFVKLVAALASTVASAQISAPVRPPADLRTFYLALLSKGPSWTADNTAATRRLQDQHLAHLAALAAAGRAAIAGPFGDDTPLRGLVILKASSIDEARTFEAKDPAVIAGRLVAEIAPLQIAGNWFAFGAIPAEPALRQFVVGFVTTGDPARGAPDDGAAVQDARAAYLWNLRRTGALVMAGDFDAAGARRAFVVYAVDDPAKARDLADADPAVARGHLTIELHPWFAADGIMTSVK